MRPAATRRLAPRPTARDAHVPAPTGGLNLISPATALPPSDCLALYNMVGSEEGLRARLGYREWCTNLVGADTNEVRTILPFTGSQYSTNKLFACTEDGIWDVTNSSTAPTKVLSFATGSARSGRGIGCVAVTAAGHFLLYCDEENGYHIYTESTGTWAAGSVSGVNAVNLVHVMVWKNRVWFTERDSGRGWYLPTYAITGTATSWNFGMKFRSGGFLVGLYNWTIDGGAGIDDSLVAISSGGDVVIYQGTDPDSAGAGLFGIQGVWFIAAPPAGRRIASDFGGDMWLLSSQGVLPLSRLVAGSSPFDSTKYLTRKIAPLVSQYMNLARNSQGWSLRVHPQENCLLITVPTAAPGSAGSTQPTTQLAYSFATESWSVFGPIDSAATASTRGLPIFSAETYDGKLYFGTVDGRVCVVDEYVDGVTLANPNASSDIAWSFLTGFANYGTARQKRVGLIRPAFLSSADSPAYAFAAKFNLDQSELSAPSAGTAGSSSWDTGIWDSALWGADQQAILSVLGASGMGAHVAIAGRGTSRSKTILSGFDITYDIGGVL